MSGNFVISLDFELMWGVFDNKTIENYSENILGARTIVSELLNTFNHYQISATWATVGFLFFDSKSQLSKHIPTEIPKYDDAKLSPYSHLSKVGETEQSDPYHFAKSLIALISGFPNQEIATHTFSHYYCSEKGSSPITFKQDLMEAINVAKIQGFHFKSIVFPRNQIRSDYLQICADLGLQTYRGNQASYLYKSGFSTNEPLLKRAVRFLDSYLNIYGHNIYDIRAINNGAKIFNIPASSFLRPYSSKIAMFDFLKLWRIKQSMTQAAKKNMTFHLWWHPHNFGKNQEENMRMLKLILDHYNLLKKRYSFKSINMADLFAHVQKDMA